MSDAADSSLLEKKDVIGKRLQEREDVRVKEVNRRKEEADKVASDTENTSFFMETLTAGVAAIKEGLTVAPHQPKDSLVTYFDGLSSKLAEIQKFVTDSAMFLSSYDLQQKQKQLKELQAEIAGNREILMPKKKFAFKNKKKQTGSPKDAAAGGESFAPKTTKDFSSDMAADEYRISSISQQVVNIAADAIHEKDVIVSSIADCTLQIKGVPSAMHLTDVERSTILCGPCARSVFIERCSNCVLVLACQQLRIHEAVNCTFFIHVTSKAIIEDSKELKFAPYQLSYDGIEDHYKESGLNKQINNWYDVDDFNWLVRDKQSPNWSILTEDERVSHAIEMNGAEGEATM